MYHKMLQHKWSNFCALQLLLRKLHMLSRKRQPALGKIWASAQVVVANVGDSRALLIRDGKAKLRLIGFNRWRCSETLWDFLNVEDAVTSPRKGTQNTDWKVHRHSATLMYLLVSHIPQKFVWNCYGNDINVKQCQMFEGDVNLELFVIRQKDNDRYIYIYKLHIYIYIWYCILYNWHHIHIYSFYMYMIFILKYIHNMHINQATRKKNIMTLEIVNFHLSHSHTFHTVWIQNTRRLPSLKITNRRIPSREIASVLPAVRRNILGSSPVMIQHEGLKNWKDED